MVIFPGEYIDRGPTQKESVEIVRGMVEAAYKNMVAWSMNYCSNLITLLSAEMTMKYFTLCFFFVSITACDSSLSQSEQRALFSRMCSEINQTRNFESSLRARIYNDAMEKAGRNATYSNLVEANFKFGGCDADVYVR
jgi:hypothetical protein